MKDNLSVIVQDLAFGREVHICWSTPEVDVDVVEETVEDEDSVEHECTTHIHKK